MKYYIAAITLFSQSQLMAVGQAYDNWKASINWASLNFNDTDQQSQFGDPDKDSLTNLEEYTMGSDPLTFSPPHVVNVSSSPAYSTISFVEKAVHPSSYTSMSLSNGGNKFEIAIPVGASRVLIPNTSLVSISFNFDGAVTAGSLSISGSQITLKEAENLRSYYNSSNGRIFLRWDDKSTEETEYIVQRRTYNQSTGSLVSATTLPIILPPNTTSYEDPFVATNLQFYSYSVVPRRPHPSLPGYFESGTNSDYAMLKYSTSAASRDMDLDFVPDSVDLDSANPFDAMYSKDTIPELWVGSTVLVVRKSPQLGEFSSISQALASTPAQSVRIDIYPGTYVGNFYVAPSRNVFIWGQPAGLAPANRIVLEAPSTGVNLIRNDGGLMCRNIVFKGKPGSTRAMIWAYGSDVFTRSTFENCIFTNHLNATYAPLLLDYGRNRIVHCTFMGNSNSSYGQSIYCSNVGPSNRVDKSIFYNLGTTYELATQLFCFDCLIKNGSIWLVETKRCFAENPGLDSSFRNDYYSRVTNDHQPSNSIVDIDGEPRDLRRPDIGADEWVDQNLDLIPDSSTPLALLDGYLYRDLDGDGTLNGDEPQIDRLNPNFILSSINNSLIFSEVSKKEITCAISSAQDPNQPPAFSYLRYFDPVTGRLFESAPGVTTAQLTVKRDPLGSIGFERYLLVNPGSYFQLYDVQDRVIGPQTRTKTHGPGLLVSGFWYDQPGPVGGVFTIEGPSYQVWRSPTYGDSDIALDTHNGAGVTAALRIYAQDPHPVVLGIVTLQSTRSNLVEFNAEILRKFIGNGRNLSEWGNFGFEWIIEGVALQPQ